MISRVMNVTVPTVMVNMLHISVATSIACVTIVPTAGLLCILLLALKTIAAL